MRSKPVPATCDPNFDETFYFCLDQIQKQGKQSDTNDKGSVNVNKFNRSENVRRTFML